MSRFSRDGMGVLASFTASEASILINLAGQLINLLRERSREAGGSEADVLYAQMGIGGASHLPLDPALARLLPDAYRQNDTAASEHRHLTEFALVDRKVANARVVIACLETPDVRLDPPASQAWLRTLNDLRLTIAARLQIEVDGDVGIGDDAMLDVYDWLGYLQSSLVEVLE